MSHVGHSVESIALNKESICKDTQSVLTEIYNKREEERLDLLYNFEKGEVKRFVDLRTKAADERNFHKANRFHQLAKLAQRRQFEFDRQLALHRWRVRYRLEDPNEKPCLKEFTVKVEYPTGKPGSRTITDY